MGSILRRSTLVIIVTLLGFQLSPAWPDDAPPLPKRPPTLFLDPAIRFETGTLQEGVKYYSDANGTLSQLPPEMVGLQFTRRKSSKPGPIDIDADPGTTVYAILDTDSNSKDAHVIALHKRVAELGWTRLEDIKCVNGGKFAMLAVYKLVADSRAFVGFYDAADTDISFATKKLRIGIPPYCTTSSKGKPWMAAVGAMYLKNDTEIGTIAEGAKYFKGANTVLGKVPAELAGMSFARRPQGASDSALGQAGPGSKVFLLLDSDKGPNSKSESLQDTYQLLSETGWTPLGDTQCITGRTVVPLAVYELDAKANISFGFFGAGPSGYVVAGNDLKLTALTAAAANNVPKRDTAPAMPHEDRNLSDKPEIVAGTGPATQISRKQSTIKTLYVYEQDNGQMLGGASDFILTATPGTGNSTTQVMFATPVGDQMHLVLQDVLRSICVEYPRWDAKKVELSFENKYIGHDGGSIGAATGTLLLSMIEGFTVDPHLAMTGDVTADGKVRKIGGVAAKLRGAAAAGCTIVALPDDNYDQVVDAMIYNGQPTVLNLQIIGIGNLTEAVAAARADRTPDLVKAISLFSEIQQSAAKSSGYIRSKPAQEKLAQVLTLAPNHFSAKLLLSVAQDKQRKKLSAAASEYYTFVAVASMIPALEDQDQAVIKSRATPTAITEGIKKLQLLRPMADPAVQPMLDGWVGFIGACSDLNTGRTTMNALEERRRELKDAMEKLDANEALSEKMLKEGI